MKIEKSSLFFFNYIEYKPKRFYDNGYKLATRTAVKSAGKSGFNFKKFIARQTVLFQIILVGYQPPNQMSKRFLNINKGMGHDDAFLADAQPAIRSPSQKTIKTEPIDL